MRILYCTVIYCAVLCDESRILATHLAGRAVLCNYFFIIIVEIDPVFPVMSNPNCHLPHIQTMQYSNYKLSTYFL